MVSVGDQRPGGGWRRGDWYESESALRGGDGAGVCIAEAKEFVLARFGVKGMNGIIEEAQEIGLGEFG